MISSNISRIIARLNEQTKSAQPNSPELRSALTRIGILIQTQTKINIRQRGIIDTGRLLNSIRYEFFLEQHIAGINVGSFGVPYAAMNEFGGIMTENQRRAMFAALARSGKLKGGRKSKNVITREGRWKARPYLRPAVRNHTERIIAILREALTNG